MKAEAKTEPTVETLGKKFEVDVLCEATSNGVLVYLESTELNELIQKSIDGIIDAELEHFKEIVCIEQ